MAPQPETPPGGPAWIELPDKSIHPVSGDCYFGRIAGNEIVVPDTKTSRRHAVVQRQGSHFVIVDLGSTNGTRLNDRRVFKPAPLKDGDVIGVGGLRYVFRIPAGAAEFLTSQPLPTTAAVGITPCWVLVASVPEPGDAATAAWFDGIAGGAAQAGGKVRRIRGAMVLAHWRVAHADAAAVRGFVESVAGRPFPPGAHAALHQGQVRVGPGSAHAEETLVGSDVTFTHSLAAAARELGATFVLSETAARTLGLAAVAAPLGPKSVKGSAGEHPLYSLGGPGSG